MFRPPRDVDHMPDTAGTRRGVLSGPAFAVRRQRLLIVSAALCLFVCLRSSATTSASGPQDSQPTQPRIFHEGIAGRLVICGGGNLSEDIRNEFLESIPEDGKIVVLAAASSTRSETADQAVGWLREATEADIATPDAEPEQSDSDTESAVRAIAAVLADADAVWICGGQQSRLAAAYGGTDVETALESLLQRGGVIGGTSAGAAIMSHTMIASGKESPNMATGFDLLPGAIVDQHFSERDRIGRSRQAVSAHPDLFGLGIDESTAVIVEGRMLRVLGSGTATVLLAKSDQRVSEDIVMSAGHVADLTQLRRAARLRSENFDAGIPRFGARRVENGSLVIVGGGGLPQDIIDRFIELAGGKDARIVYLPTAVPRRQAMRASVPGFLRNADVASVTLLAQSREAEVESEEFRAALQSATGIWFGGGRQWNFVDAYEGTTAVELFRDVLRRGGVIGGSSAGATIQGEFLVRGHPLGNTVMMAEGYERGFAFLPGTAIDQHFTQRGRLPDLPPVIERNPQMLGIGIDEATALVVRGSTAEVLGDHAVHFLTHDMLNRETASAKGTPQNGDDSSPDNPSPTIDESDSQQPPYLSVPSGGRIDLIDLTVTLPTEEAAEAGAKSDPN